MNSHGVSAHDFNCSLWDELFSRERNAHKHLLSSGKTGHILVIEYREVFFSPKVDYLKAISNLKRVEILSIVKNSGLNLQFFKDVKFNMREKIYYMFLILSLK